MKRREFLNLAGMGFGGAMLSGIPISGRAVPPDQPWTPGEPAIKKQWADNALNAAKSKGATYTDVRIGRYLTNLLLPAKTKCRIL